MSDDERKMLPAWRWLHGISQAELARRVGVSGFTMSVIESGQNYAGAEVALRIEEATGGAVRAEWLMNPADIARWGKREQKARYRPARVPRTEGEEATEGS